MKIHFVFPSHFEPLKQTLEELGHTVVEWDYTLEQFSVFSSQKQTNADVAFVDGTAGIRTKQDAYQFLKEVRTNLPLLRVILHLPEAVKQDKVWIEKVLALAIYDLHFANEFDEEDVERWLNTPLTFADHSIEGRKIEGNMEGGSPQYKEKETNNPEATPRLFSRIFKNRVDTDNIRGNNPFRSFLPQQQQEVKSEEPPSMDRKKIDTPILAHPETITVFSGKGGVGVTAITLHLAKKYANLGIKVGVLDFGFPFGHISSYLNLAPSPYVLDIIKSNTFYVSEGDWFKGTVEKEGIRYLLPPNFWPMNFKFEESIVDRLVRNMQRFSTITINDFNNHHDLPTQQMMFSLSTRILWVLDMNRASVYQAKRQLLQLRECGFHDEGKIQFIINRVSHHDLPLPIIEETLGHSIYMELPEEPDLSVCLNKGSIVDKNLQGLQRMVGKVNHRKFGLKQLVKGWT